jgi:hypothetical protein
MTIRLCAFAQVRDSSEKGPCMQVSNILCGYGYLYSICVPYASTHPGQERGKRHMNSLCQQESGKMFEAYLDSAPGDLRTLVDKIVPFESHRHAFSSRSGVALGSPQASKCAIPAWTIWKPSVCSFNSSIGPCKPSIACRDSHRKSILCHQLQTLLSVEPQSLARSSHSSRRDAQIARRAFASLARSDQPQFTVSVPVILIPLSRPCQAAARGLP